METEVKGWDQDREEAAAKCAEVAKKKSDINHREMTANEWTANMPEHHLEGYSNSKKSVAQVRSLSKAEMKA